MYILAAQHVHMKEVTLTELRRNIFRLVDEALATGEPIVVKRKGRTVTLAPDAATQPSGRPAPDDEEGWAKFWAQPSEIKEDLSLDELNEASRAYWRWDEEPELELVIHLDTHAVVWLAERSARLSQTAKRLAEREALFISPAVDFELEVLAEAGRLRSDAGRILSVAMRDYNLIHSAAPFIDVVGRARTFAWTRDPFDRLIVANAMADGVRLLTADTLILRHFKDAIW